MTDFPRQEDPRMHTVYGSFRNELATEFHRILVAEDLAAYPRCPGCGAAVDHDHDAGCDYDGLGGRDDEAEDFDTPPWDP